MILSTKFHFILFKVAFGNEGLFPQSITILPPPRHKEVDSLLCETKQTPNIFYYQSRTDYCAGFCFRDYLSSCSLKSTRNNF